MARGFSDGGKLQLGDCAAGCFLLGSRFFFSFLKYRMSLRSRLVLNSGSPNSVKMLVLSCELCWAAVFLLSDPDAWFRVERDGTPMVLKEKKSPCFFFPCQF